MSATIKITEPDGRTRDIILKPDATYLIGRAKENDIMLNDRRVSRKHAHIRPSMGGFMLVDGSIENGAIKRSVNHLFVNGAQAEERMLQPGDKITIGESTLEYGETKPEIPLPVQEDVLPHDFLAPPGGTKAQHKSVVKTAQPAGNDDFLAPPSTKLSQAAIRAASNDAPTHVQSSKGVSYDDKPLGQTQMLISANEIIGRQSHLSLESAIATPEEIKDLRRKAKILELLYEMSKSLGTIFDLKEIFERATDLIFRGTPADRVVALIADETVDGKILDYSLYPVAVKTRNESIEKLTEKLTISRTITQKVMREKVALLSQDAKTDAEFSKADSIVSQGVRSTICAPLITESNVHGVLYADRLDPFASFTPDHLELISAVAAQTAVTVETIKAHKRLAREEVARANYSRFMPEYVVKQLLDNPNSFKLGGVNQTITVLFADIRGFTSTSEHENPEKIVTLLNRYFTAMSEIIFAHGGTLDKYIGDGLMALFGAPTATPEDALNAVKAAVTMQKRLASLNKELAQEKLGTVAVGIGLHTGVATVGYIGSERRSEYTAIGDTVNLASRLESHAKGGQILMSDATAQASGSMIPFTEHEPLTVKNRTQPVKVLEVRWE